MTIVSPTTIVGHKLVYGWPGRRDVYFAMQLSKPIKQCILNDDIARKIKRKSQLDVHEIKDVKIDGIFNEPGWNLNKEAKKVLTGKTENTAWFDVAWDSKYLYVAVMVTDTAICVDSEKSWNDDGIEIYIDGNCSKDGQYDDNDRQLALVFGKDGVTEARGKPINVIQKSVKTAKGYNVEIAVEMESMYIKPVAGNYLGFDLVINDDDNFGDRDCQFVWTGISENWQTTEFLGTIQLVDGKQKCDKPELTIKPETIDINKYNVNKFPKDIVMGKGIKSIFTINTGSSTELLVKVGISTTSSDAALKAINAEIPDWDFNKIRSQASDNWANELTKITIEAPENIKDIFYTGLYHSLIQPNVISDIDGKFRGPEGKIYTAPTGKFYSTFSLWDTYRAWNPLMTIIDTTRVTDMINTLLFSFDFYGFLPRWALWGTETHTMIGNHSISVITDAYFKGIKGFDVQRAYQTMKASSMTQNPISNWPVYNKYGYLPYDIEKIESVSRTLEMSFNDWCVAQMAKSLGKTDDYNYFAKRGTYYKNMFDPSTGFMRGKDSTGKWVPNFSSIDIAHGGSGHGCYTEGNAWQHAWYVPQNIPDLVAMMGGPKAFVSKLDSLFSIETIISGDVVPDVTGLIGQYAHGNEPSHHVAYLYNYGGEAWKTQEIVRRIMKTLYYNTRGGLCGNDDCGQMSAWYILSAMGFYPVNPSNGIFDIGSPIVEKAAINVRNNTQFVVDVKNQSDLNIYIQSLKLNGKPLTKPFITYNDIMNGGKLEFIMGKKPNKSLFK